MIITPPLVDGPLPGVVRRILLDEIKNIDGYKIIESHVTPELAMNSSEIFITNSLLGIRSIKKFNDIIINEDNTTKLLQTIIYDRFFS